MSLDNECCICYEIIRNTNNCVTECGHKFCLSCIITTMKRSSVCPCCRFSLREEDIEGDTDDYTHSDEYTYTHEYTHNNDNNDEDADNEYEDEDEENSSDDDEEEDDDDNNDDDDEVTTETNTYVKMLENIGVSLLDITALFLRNEYHIISKKFTNNQMNEIDKKICIVIGEIRNEE